MPKNNLIISVVVIILVIGGIFYFTSKKDLNPTLAPTTSDISSWKTYTDSKRGITFKYPEVATTYVKLLDWPPKVEVTSEEVVCTNAGEEGARAGETVSKKINGREYCITTIVEGAAGSTYTQYAYGTELDDRFVFFTFSSRAPQCGNYDEDKRALCEAEKADLNIDALIDRIVSTATLKAEDIIYKNTTADSIVVDNPFPGAVVGKEFIAVGKANWYFEGSFPIKVLDKNGKQLVETYATAQGEWMTSELVPFKSQPIKIPVTYTGPATIIFHNDNASGLPEHDASMEFPITIEY